MNVSARLTIPVVLCLIAAAACGTDESSPTPGTATPATSGSTVTDPQPTRTLAMPARQQTTASSSTAGQAVEAFGHDVLTSAMAIADPADNVVVSPLSIAIALAMLEPGATGTARTQLRALLRIDDPAAWHTSMNALEQALESRVAELSSPDDQQDPGEFVARVANAAFVQPGYPFLPDYLDVVGTNYGAVIEELDFFTDQTAAAQRINEFVAEGTDDHITDLVSESDIRPETVLALVNALLLRASWQTDFEQSATADDDFVRLDGSAVTLPLMHGSSDRSARGDGWVAASKRLMGEIRLDVVLPDEGRFEAVSGDLADVFDVFDLNSTSGSVLVVPRFEARVDIPLTDLLLDLGLTAPFEEGNLLDIAGDPKLVLDEALHQSWLSIDESGIEAAAATVLVMIATSAPALQPVPVVLDRPFLFRIVDESSSATLFSGRIMDPTA